MVWTRSRLMHTYKNEHIADRRMQAMTISDWPRVKIIPFSKTEFKISTYS